MIGRQTELTGNLRLSGDLVVMGAIIGNIYAEDGSSTVLNLSETARIEGEVRVPNVVIDGEITGDVYATEQVELGQNARVNGNVYYSVIQMEMGAEVNGSLVHIEHQLDSRLTLGHEPNGQGLPRALGDESNSSMDGLTHEPNGDDR